ncbi:alpha/beta fold hydrolase [Acinetobacter sp. CUI P1]|nr:alpha/beta fold hydrolase [Acinetobacter sp. CUI P1]
MRLILRFNDDQQIDAILIIHGAGMNLRSWDLIVPYLQQHYHILRYDLRGHGLSDKGQTN